MSGSPELVGGLTGLVAVLALALAAPAAAQCRNVWAPSPEGAQLILICDGNTGSGGGKDKGKKGRKKQTKKPGAVRSDCAEPGPDCGVGRGRWSGR